MKLIRLSLLFFTTVFVSACNLTVENTGGGVVTSQSGKINCGATCIAQYSGTVNEVLMATPLDGYFFAGWSGACTGTSSCNVTISNSGNKKVVAQFTKRVVDIGELPKLPYTNELSESALYVTGVEWEISADAVVDNVAKPHAVIKVIGKGFSGNLVDDLVIFETTSGNVVATPTSATPSVLEVSVPDGASGLFVVAKNFRSNGIDLEILSQNVPVLAQNRFIEARIGDQITLEGSGFVQPMTANIGGVTTDVSVIGDNEIRVNIPSGVTSGSLYVQNSSGVSNAIKIRVVSPVSVQVVRPANSALNFSSMEISGAGLGEVMVSADGTAALTTNANKLELMQVSWIDASNVRHPYLMGWALPSRANITISSRTTAEAKIALLLGGGLLEADEAEILMGIITTTPEVDALAALLDAALSANPRFLENPSAQYFQAVNTAGKAVTTRVKAQSQVAIQKVPLQGPDITPGEQHGISVVADKDDSGEFSGFVNVRNASHVFLSAQFVEIATGLPTLKHEPSLFAKLMVQPSATNKLAKTQDKFRACQFVDCTVEIVTPGFNPKSNNQPIAKILSTRTVIEGILYPVVSQLLIDDAFSANTFTQILVAAAPMAVDNLAVGLNHGTDVDRAVGDFIDFLIDDVTTGGPITAAILDRAGDAVKQQLQKKMLERWIPVLREILLFIDTAQLAASIYDYEETILEMTRLPGDVSFDAIWPLQITGINPGSLPYDEGSKTLFIEGQGLDKIQRITLLDTMETQAINLIPGSISSNKKRIAVVVPGTFLERAGERVRVIAYGAGSSRSESPDYLLLEGCSPLILDRYRIMDSDGDPQNGKDCSVVKDMVSQLEWMRCSAGQKWNQQNKSCDGGGYRWPRPGNLIGATSFLEAPVPAGWRIPAIAELRTLVYCSSGSPARFGMPLNETNCGTGSLVPTISHEAFPNTPAWGFWSKTPSETSEDFWWIARMDLGLVNGGGYNLYYHLRFVRGG